VNRLAWQHPSERLSYAQCLACSVVLHAAALAGGMALVAGLELAPQPEPFRWEVSVVGQGAPSTSSARLNSSPAAEREPAEPPPPALTRKTQPAQSQMAKAVQQEPPTRHPPLRDSEQKRPEEEAVKALPSESPAESLSQASRPVAQAAPAPESAPAIPPSEPLVASRSPIEAPSSPAQVPSSDLRQDTPAEAASPPVTESSASNVSVQTGPTGSPDYGWIADALWKRIEQLKRYPHQARLNRLEGKVILRAVIKADGQLVDLEVAKSSGHSVLDHDAMEVLRRASPLPLTRPLGKPQMVVQIPISYKLDR